MKSKIFKKLIAGAATLAMIAQFGIVLPASAAVTGSFLSTDFSSKPETTGVTWGEYVTLNDNSKLNKSTISFAGDAAAIGFEGSAANYTIATMTTPIGDTSNRIDASFRLAKRYNGENHTLTMSFDDASGNTVAGVQYGLTARNGSQLVNAITNDATNNSAQLTAYTDNVWTTYNVSIVYLSASSGYVTINGATLPFNGAAISAISLKSTGSAQSRGMVLDDLKVDVTTPATASYLVTYKYGEDSEKIAFEAADSGAALAKIPNPEVEGLFFRGWNDGSETYETLDSYAVSGNVIFTAQYGADDSYIEPIVTAELSGPRTMTLGEDADTEAENVYTLKLTGEKGTVITDSNYDERVEDFKVDWKFLGLKTENDTEDQYCDSYASIASHADNATSVKFMLKGVAFNFYGLVKATVTYNNQTIVSNILPVVVLGDKSVPAKQILPEAGYASDFSEYSDDLIGEKYGYDGILFGNFGFNGSDTCDVSLKSEGGVKFLQFKKTTARKSAALTHSIPATTSGQIIFEQDLKFTGDGGAINFTGVNPTWNDKGYDTAFSLTYAGNKLSLCGTALTDPTTGGEVTIAGGTWYKVVISTDKSTMTSWAKVFNKESGNCIAEASNVPWTDTTTTVANSTSAPNPTYYSVSADNGIAGAVVGFNNYRVYQPTADSSKFTITADDETLKIPDAGQPASVTNLTASAKTAEDYDIIGAAEWVIDDEALVAEGKITITADAADSHKAVLSVAEGASAGDVPIKVTINGESVSKTITLTSSDESVKFTSSPTSISIPLDSSKTEKAQYTAVVINGDGETVETQTVTYALYDRNNTNEITTMPTGVTFNKTTGELTVSSSASAATYYVRALSTNTQGQSINKAVKVTVHGLAFDFGTDAEDAIAEGYTPVTASTTYSASRGYGVEGTVTVGGTASAADKDSDYIEGSNFKFKVNVTPGEVYTITAKYKGIMTSEATSGITEGHVRNRAAGDTTYTGYGVTATELTEYTLDVPVIDDVMDLNFSTNCAISSISIQKKNRVASAKPAVWAIGDSTLGNAGSYGYVLGNQLNNTAEYPEFAEFAGLISAYHNVGKGSRTFVNYIEQGWLDSVLAGVNPGDVVTIGNMGTNAGGLSGDAFATYYKHYAEACIKMGANVIFTSYTPHGPKSGYENTCYNSSTYTFSGERSNDDYEKQGVRVVYEEMKDNPNVLGFVEIGKNADAAFTAYANDGADETEKAARAKEIIDSFGDHNHYAGPNGDNRGGTRACRLMLAGYTPTNGEHIEGIIEQIVNILNNKYEISSIAASQNGADKITFTATATSGNGAQTARLIVAQYMNNALVDVSMTDAVFSKSVTAVDVEYTPVSGATVRAFAWDSNMMPYLTNTAVTPAE